MKTKYTYFASTTRFPLVVIALAFCIRVIGSENEIPEPISELNSPTFEVENEIQVEKWMVDLEKWNLNTELETSVEEELKIESWMLNLSAFSTELVDIETEEEIEFENWMINLYQW